ncbi:MAG TPA: M50 family metallopeptidase [Pyrinomonadaceae bacterium]|nr:M50 family metallopeptidase [Pyrinomonadaceae bacterium]
MKYKLAEDAKPQLTLLLIATVITIALWFIPFADYLVYPIRLFVTFIHEGSHVLASLLTGGSVHSLTISADGSGVVYSVPSGTIGALLTSSAGYLGSTAFGVLLLLLMRKQVSPKKILFGSAAFVAVMTLFFSVLAPIFNIFSLEVGIFNIAFTIIAGALISAGLFALGKYASLKVASFSVAFLAVQCLLNAISDLKTLFFINSPIGGMDMANDATNMQNATGIPSFAWVVIWIGISIVMISIGLRVYAVTKTTNNHELPFED